MADVTLHAPLLARSPSRVLSLVPSLTESLCDLGLGERLVAVTDYCVHPAEAVKGIPHIGGTKDPRLDEILALRPDLVLANQEENRPQDLACLRDAGLNVWVTFPQTVRQALDLLWEVVRLFDVPAMGSRLLALEYALDWTRAAAHDRAPISVFCPIWRGPPAGSASKRASWWMTVNAATYVHDLLAVCGGRNVFEERDRQYPLAAGLGRADNAEPEQPAGDDRSGQARSKVRVNPATGNRKRDTRYPRVSLAEIVASQPDVILLPSEPYAFGEADREELMSAADVPAAREGRVHLVDGSLLTWHGTRLARALRDIPPVLALR